VLTYQGAVRAMITATVTRPELAHTRPGLRFGLIDQRWRRGLNPEQAITSAARTARTLTTAAVAG